jgi:hypothetical protein
MPGEMISSNVVYSERCGLRCIDWSDAFFGRPYLESLPLSRVIRVRGKQNKSEETVMGTFHETAVARLESRDFVEHFDKARPLRYLRRFAIARRGERIDPHSVEASDLTENIWEFLVKADKCLRDPKQWFDEEGNLEDVDPDDLETDRSSDDDPVCCGDRAVAAVATEEADDDSGNSDNANSFSAKDAENMNDNEKFGDRDDNGDGGVKASNDDVDRSRAGRRKQDSDEGANARANAAA